MNLSILNHQQDNEAAWATYLAWNDAVAEEYFTGRWAGAPVYMDMEPDVLSRLGQHLTPPGEQPEDAFVDAVAATMQLKAGGRRAFSRHVESVNAWRRDDSAAPPPCLAVLGLLSLIAEAMTSDDQYRATNYTDRLCDRLAIHDDRARQRLKRDFREQTHILWDEFNAWLDDHDGSLGLPTAYAFDYRVHVGIPISQALVREHDRQRLKQLFAVYRLSPGQRLPVPDMLGLLEDWAVGPDVSASFRALWGDKALRERIAAIACVELEAWEGGFAEERRASDPIAPLVFVGVVRSHPVPRLVLELRVRAAQGAPVGSYRSTDSSGSEYALGLCEQPQWLQLTPPPSTADVLLATFNVLDGDGFTLQREPRRLVTLKLDETDRLYVEVPRVELNETYLILAHRTIAELVTSYLSIVARDGFSAWGSHQLGGLPEDWVAIRGVSVVDVVDPGDDDLASLAPMARTQLTLAGGFALPGRSVWHVTAPPELRVAAPYEDSVHVSIVPTHTFDGEDTNAVTIEAIGAVGAFDMRSLGIAEGDYRVNLRRGTQTKGALLSTASLRLRSSAHARLAPPDVAELHHDLVNVDLAALSADDVSSGNGQTVRGARIPIVAAAPSASVAVRDDQLDSWGDPNDDHDDPPMPTAASVAAPDCLLTGAHHSMLEPGQGRVLGTCKHCGLEKWHGEPRPLRDRSVDPGQRHQIAEARPELLLKPINPDADRPTADDLLDALTFAKRGFWPSFHRLASQVDDAPWFPVESARLLSALGHIEVALDPITLRPKAWAISPPTLAVLADGRAAVLCGARWPELTDRVIEDAEAIGGIAERMHTDNAPTTVLIRGLGVQDLRLVAASVRDAAPLSLVVTDSAGAQLAEQLPTLGALAASLPSTPWLSAPTEIFDVSTGRWRSVDYPTHPGAYRIGTRPWTFAWRAAVDGQLRVGDSRVVKHLAGAALGQALLAYDRASQRLTTPLGAALPGLYERAAVLCSGLPPTRRAGSVCYELVPESVADAIAARMHLASQLSSRRPA